MTCFCYIDSDAAVTMLDEDADDVSTEMAQQDESTTLPLEGDGAASGNTSNLTISIISKVYLLQYIYA